MWNLLRSFSRRTRPGVASGVISLVGLVAFLFLARLAHAAPTLTPVPGMELPNAMQTGQKVSLRLRYVDANGDDISKSTATMVDDGPDGRKTFTATDIDGNDPAKGQTITWEVNGFAAGPHQAYFQVTPTHPTGHVARYPEGEGYYTFGVEAPWLKWAELGGGMAVCLFMLPFVTYLVFRSLNPRSDPSRAARGALFLGILAVCALFVYLFAGIIGLPIVIGIAVVAAIIGLIIVFGRR